MTAQSRMGLPLGHSSSSLTLTLRPNQRPVWRDEKIMHQIFRQAQEHHTGVLDRK